MLVHTVLPKRLWFVVVGGEDYYIDEASMNKGLLREREWDYQGLLQRPAHKKPNLTV